MGNFFKKSKNTIVIHHDPQTFIYVGDDPTSFIRSYLLMKSYSDKELLNDLNEIIENFNNFSNTFGEFLHCLAKYSDNKNLLDWIRKNHKENQDVSQSVYEYFFSSILLPVEILEQLKIGDIVSSNCYITNDEYGQMMLDLLDEFDSLIGFVLVKRLLSFGEGIYSYYYKFEVSSRHD